jgi:hypothetical protein
VLIHKDALQVHAVASTDATRPNLNGVHIGPDGTLTATDGHRLIRCRIEAGDEADYPCPSPDWAPPVIPAEGIILPTADARTAAKLPPKKSRIQLLCDHVQLESCNGRIRLSATDLDTRNAIDSRPTEGPYPNVEAVLPVGDPVAVVCFNPILMAETLLAMVKCLGCGKDAAPQVRMEIHADKNGAVRAIRIDAQKPGRKVMALVMPQTPLPDSGRAF